MKENPEDKDTKAPKRTPIEPQRPNTPRLTLILPDSHPAVAPNGLLMDRAFPAGPVTIVCQSVCTHRTEGAVTVTQEVPYVRIKPSNAHWQTTELLATPDDFAEQVATALDQARNHQAAVVEFINEQLDRLAVQRIERKTAIES